MSGLFRACVRARVPQPWRCSDAAGPQGRAAPGGTQEPPAPRGHRHATESANDVAPRQEHPGAERSSQDRLDEPSAQVPDQGGDQPAHDVGGQHLPREIESRRASRWASRWACRWARRMAVAVAVPCRRTQGEKSVEQELGHRETRDHPAQPGQVTEHQEGGAQDQPGDTKQPRDRRQGPSGPGMGDRRRDHDLGRRQRRPRHRVRCRTDAGVNHSRIIADRPPRVTGNLRMGGRFPTSAAPRRAPGARLVPSRSRWA